MKTSERNIAGFDVSRISGLSEAEAAQRLKKAGYNELPSTRKRSAFAIAFGVVREPMFLLLIGAGVIYLIIGSLPEALTLLLFVFVIMGITFVQERRTERTLEALRNLSSPRALVIRDGEQKRIVGREVVPGDILILSEGDRVPADAVLLACTNLMVDESLLTGESIPVRKASCGEEVTDIARFRPGGDGLPFVFSGTLVVRGQGIARAEFTGIQTEMGKIGKTLQKIEPEKTSLHIETAQLVKNIAIVGLSFSLIIVIVYGFTRGNWLDGVLAGITLGMAVLPEEFPVVLTVFLALGAWRISKERVLTRQMPAIEALGSATVLCVDKTGTLTMNRMTVKKILVSGQFLSVDSCASGMPESFHEITEFSILASQKTPSDPMDKAFKELGLKCLNNTEHLHEDWVLMREYPLSENLLALSQVWKSPSSNEYVIAAKGAPEAIADLCHFNQTQLKELTRNVEAMAEEGLRVLGVAKAHFRQTDILPGKQHDFSFQCLGLIGLADPVRPGVREAIGECYCAGIKVIMITGDYPATAKAIAHQIGLIPADQFITGPELDEMSEIELQKRINSVSICARVMPEHKLRIVNALKANGEIVAMTGDGVNDAPALKASNIGIAMGSRGTDVAREASALVLLDDDFSSIVQANRLGRRIFDNLRKAMSYIFAIHIPIVGMSLIPVLLGLPLVLMPVHIVFLELIIDPASSLVFEAEPAERGIMERPPRNPKQRVFNRRALILSVIQGVSVLAIVLAVYLVALDRNLAEPDARALSFTTLIIANLGLILSNRSWSRSIVGIIRRPNRAVWGVLGGAVFFLGLVLYVPPLRDLFNFASLHAVDIAIAVGAGAVSVAWFEVFKLITRKSTPVS